MPKLKGHQLSGAKKRQIAKQKAASERSAIASAPRLDRFLVHSKAKDDITNTDSIDNSGRSQSKVDQRNTDILSESDSDSDDNFDKAKGKSAVDLESEMSHSDSDQSSYSDDDQHIEGMHFLSV